MNRFLVETSYLPEDDTMLHVFDDAELVKFLTENIQRDHYESDGYEIRYVGQYLGRGTLRNLTLRRVSEQRDQDDYLDWSYELISAGRADLGDDPELTEFGFTVRIDGRA